MQVNELFEQDPLGFPLLSGSGESTLEYFSRLSLVPLPSVRPGTTSTRAIVGPNLSQGSLIFVMGRHASYMYGNLLPKGPGGQIETAAFAKQRPPALPA
jgi:hypothetical protein